MQLKKLKKLELTMNHMSKPYKTLKKAMLEKLKL